MKTAVPAPASVGTLDNHPRLRLDERMDAGTAGKLIETALARMRTAYFASL